MCKFIGIVLINLFLLACTAMPSISESLDPLSTHETVILLHGLGRSDSAMWLLQGRLEEAGYKVYALDYDSFQQSPLQILDSVFMSIEECCREVDGTLHFVGHSLGGLIIRAYLAKHDVSKLGKVVLIGTPNHGTPLVDTYRDSWWMQFAGEMALALGTDSTSFAKSLPNPDYPFGVIAGVTDSGFNDDVFQGAHDGLVPVASTKLEGMSDFVQIEVGHSAMRYDGNVAFQTIHYLRKGSFRH